MLSKISEELNTLSAAERKVGECALAEPKWFVHAAVAEIAERAGVSQPTVIRFCRSLGYKGLPEFKLALSASISHSGLPYVHAELNIDDSMGDVMEKVLGNTAAALLGARRSLNQSDLENAVAMLTHARRIEFYGVGNSGIVAQDAQHKFFRFGISTVAYSDTHTQLMAAAVLSADDVLVVISNSGSSIELLDSVSIAKENGAQVIAITRSDSPLAQLADCVLPVAVQEDNSRYTPMVSRMLQLAVVDILAIGLALRFGETISLQLEKVKRSVRKHHVAADGDAADTSNAA
ncbi:SIS domain-containing protein [Conchiformibius steedae DSM 2580]|uniref:SIS domain-containing protein n=2 Tax=Conchiformibius steedae TaxID=153493 RepID=A0A3P2A5T2_9NEIS|nr:SIS domain-containing protein [Conchiformibius steedae]QMT33671.1 SIS domain-containing protein [Conchiformibius steedae]RRD90216.1 SIS domain-containing protein [Conchiformibius steedae]URD68332.1 SIS domain-containing protein [Conchiformibius steedae DSM 2580]